MLLKNHIVYKHLENLGNHLEMLLHDLSNGINLQIPRCASMFGIFFSSKVIDNWNDVLLSQLSYYTKFHRFMLKKGYYLPPSPYESMFVSSAHSPSDIEKTIRAARSIFN